MSIFKRMLMFGVMGTAIAVAIAGAASFAPNIFGWLTLPFWILPALGNLGAHDFDWPIALISGSLFYAILAFFLHYLLKRRRAAR